MDRNATRAAVVLTLLLAGVVTSNAQRDYQDQSLDLLRFLATKPWAGRGHNRWDRGPRFDTDLADRYGPRERWEIKPKTIFLKNDDDSSLNDDNEIKFASEKRSAVATALNGRRRRQPSAALGKEVTPYVGVGKQAEVPHIPHTYSVGVLSSVDTFFDSLRDNLEGLAYLSPQQRASLFTDTPNVVRAPSSECKPDPFNDVAADNLQNGKTIKYFAQIQGNNALCNGRNLEQCGGGGGGGGTGMRRLNALRPLRPTGNIRTYNRRSFVETDGLYPGANHHDPGLLWTGLGR